MKLELLENKPRETVRDYTYRVIRENIINFNLKPGEAISENEIASILNVSRTPVRETFAKLEGEELIEIFPQKGTFVTLIDLKRVEEARFMRLNLEKAVMELACGDFPEDVLFELEANLNQQQFCLNKKNYAMIFDLDNDMHGLIFKGCQKERVWSAIRLMNGDFDRIRTLRLQSNLSWDDNILHHKLMVKAIKEKDAALGLETIKKHLTQVIFDQKVLNEKYPMYFEQISYLK